MYQYLDLGYQLKIPMYNLMTGIGILFAVLFLDYRIKKNHISYKIEIDLYIGVILSIVAGFAGAKSFALLYGKQHISISNLFSGGMTYYGGFICGIIAFSIYTLTRKRDLLYALNIAVPSVILSHAFGRIGCFLGGCCFGKPANNFTGVVFPYRSIPFHFYQQSIKIYPVQLFESAFLFILFAANAAIIKINYNLSAYLILYGIFRFMIEFYRGDERGVLFTDILSPSQILSLALAAAGTALFARAAARGEFRDSRPLKSAFKRL